jgi:hypothetical protein
VVAGLGRASLILYDVSTLYFETDAGDVPRGAAMSIFDPAVQRCRTALNTDDG